MSARETFFPPDWASLNSFRIPSSVSSTPRQLGGLVDLPVHLRRQADACTVGTTALVGAAEGRCRCPGGGDELGNGEPRCGILSLSAAMS